MIARLKLRLLSILFTVALVLVLAWLVTRAPKPVPTWSLPDGTRLSLAGVTYGAKHELRYGSRWRDYLGASLPANWRANSKLNPRIASYSTSRSNAVVIWLRKESAAKNTTIPGLSVFVAAADENGLEGRAESHYSLYSLPNGDELTGWELKQMPRFGEKISVRIYRNLGSHLELVGEFWIPNKSGKPGQRWNAEALPATRKTNDLEVTLVKLETGLTGLESGLGQMQTSRAYSRAVFDFREKVKKQRSG